MIRRETDAPASHPTPHFSIRRRRQRRARVRASRFAPSLFSTLDRPLPSTESALAIANESKNFGHDSDASGVYLWHLRSRQPARRPICPEVNPVRAIEIVLALIAAVVVFVVLKLIGIVIKIALVGALVGLIIGFAIARAFRKT